MKGRSALGPVDPHSLQDKYGRLPAEAESEPKSSNNDTFHHTGADAAIPSAEGSILARSLDYQQQYDAKGYPENPSSEAAKRRWRHAVNDVLATVGICISKEGKPIQATDVQDSQLVYEVQVVNEYGFRVGGADAFLRLGSEYWIAPLRQRIQVSNEL